MKTEEEVRKMLKGLYRVMEEDKIKLGRIPLLESPEVKAVLQYTVDHSSIHTLRWVLGEIEGKTQVEELK